MNTVLSWHVTSVMIDDAVLPRSSLVLALLTGNALAQPAPASAPASAPAPAPAPAKPPIDARSELNAIVQRALSRPSSGPAASSVCTAPTGAEAAKAKTRALAWIDQQFPDEKQGSASDTTGKELVFNARCKDGSAVFVDVSQDRALKKTKADTYPTRRNYVLRIDGDQIEIIAARTSTASIGWMEWADEGRLAVLARVDLDGDGTADLVWTDHEHEGGAMSTWDHLSVRFATGKTAPIVRVKNLADARVVKGQLVIAGQDNDGRAICACVGKDLRVARCAAAASLQRAADRPFVAQDLASLGDAPDRDLAVGWLDTLGVKPSAALLAELPATTPGQKAERGVASFLASKQLDNAFQALFEQPHAEAIGYFDQLASQLGDQRCTPSPLTDETRAKLSAWAAKQDSDAHEAELTAECGAYAWVEWDHRGDQEHDEILVSLDGPEPARVVTFKSEQVLGANQVQGHVYDGAFFQRGDVTVGFVIHGKNLSVIANNKVVAQSHGEIVRYGYDRRWGERSPDLLVDSGTIMHPTPTGLEKLDRDLVKPHEAYRAALERVLDNPPSNSPAYLAALSTLGADARLIAACKALAP